MTGEPVFRRLALIGIGLIGSSVARAARARGLVAEVVCHSRRPETRREALELDLADHVFDTAADAARGADCVMLCTPLGSYTTLMGAIAPVLAPGTVVTDVGSVKGRVLRELSPLTPPGVHLVPGHPIAGTEHTGPAAGFPELFVGRWCILTPPADADRAAVEKVAALWRGMGSTIEEMSAEYHDKVLAITSHLPHLIAYTIVGTATDLADDIKREVIKFSASGFRDFTRIAASDPVMWRDIFLSNKEATLEIMQRFNEDLTALQRAIRRGEGDTLEELFARTREIRRGVIEAKQA
jgi:cyclohexadieny/prephenate dehydrogenase